MNDEPFYRKNPGEKDPFATGKVITVRLNAEEYKELQELKKSLNLTTESSALKLAALVGRNVLHGLLGAAFLKWLANPDRRTREPQ